MLLRTLNQLKIGDCYRPQHSCDNNSWRVVLGFSKKGNPRSEWISPKFNGMIAVEVQRGARRFEIFEGSSTQLREMLLSTP
mgnify:CR=1 FL=1